MITIGLWLTGCPELDCEHGDDPLGRYPRDFVGAVRDEGTGRITSGSTGATT